MTKGRGVTQAVILAGGLGTRLRPFTDTRPKPMFELEGKPFLGYLLEQVKAFGIEDVLILLGYLPDAIMDYAGGGERFGLHITYDVTPVEYDTGARIRHGYDQLKEHFLLLYCDNYCPFPFDRAVRAYFESGSPVQLTAYRNRDGYTRNNLAADSGHRVTCYDKARQREGLTMVDIGYALVIKDAAAALFQAQGADVNFESLVYGRLAELGQLTVFPVEHRYYSIGSWERIEDARAFFRPKKAVFLDRDGTLNVKAEKARYITSPAQFEWLAKAREAVKLLKDHGYLVILVTNQPGIARGMVTAGEVDQIHEKLQADLQEVGCRIDAIYTCPHGWDEGCFCRKPEPGLLYQAQRDLALNLPETVMIGDDERDLLAGQAAGCRKCILVSEEVSLYDAVIGLIQEVKNEHNQSQDA